MITQVKGNKRALLFPGSSDKSILFMTGFPKYPAKSELIDKLCNYGFNVIMPLYTGTFDSSGYFSIKNSVNDVFEWHDYLKKGNLNMGIDNKIKKISSNHISIFSQSYGSYIVDLAFRNYELSNIEKAIFLSPLHKPYLFKNKESDKVATFVNEIVKVSYPLSYRFNDMKKFMSEIKGEKINNTTKLPIKTKIKNPLIVIGKDDPITPPEMAEKLSMSYSEKNYHEIRGGHGSRIDQKHFDKLLKKYLL